MGKVIQHSKLWYKLQVLQMFHVCEGFSHTKRDEMDVTGIEMS